MVAFPAVWILECLFDNKVDKKDIESIQAMLKEIESRLIEREKNNEAISKIGLDQKEKLEAEISRRLQEISQKNNIKLLSKMVFYV
mgnify:CR=1 FL=1